MGKLNRPIYCACNECGLEVKPGNKYINGHNRKGQGKPVSPPHLCWCNECGLMTNPGCDYIDGHNNRGKHFSRTEEQKTAKSNAMKEYYEDPRAIEIHTIASKKWWEEHPEAKEKQAIIAFENTTKRYEDPLEREKASRSSKKMYLDYPELRGQKSIWLKEFWKDPIAREDVILKRIEFYKDPKNRKRHGEISKENYRKYPSMSQKLSARMRTFENPWYVDGRASGENNPYPLDFNERLRELIRDRDGHLCKLCSKSEKDNKRKLPVHHVDYCKDNLDPDNLVSLCSSCHTKTNSNRSKWIAFFQGPQRIANIVNGDQL